MIFGKPKLILKTKKLELRAPHYSDYDQWRHLRDNSKKFLELERKINSMDESSE